MNLANLRVLIAGGGTGAHIIPEAGGPFIHPEESQ
jgi:hypothetical protein